MSQIKIPHSYSDVPWRSIKVSTEPANALRATKVLVLTLNRPEKHNSFTVEMEDEMIAAFELFDVDDRVKVVVVTGAGRMYCAGADLDIGLHREPEEESKDHRDG